MLLYNLAKQQTIFLDVGDAWVLAIADAMGPDHPANANRGRRASVQAAMDGGSTADNGHSLSVIETPWTPEGEPASAVSDNDSLFGLSKQSSARFDDTFGDPQEPVSLFFSMDSVLSSYLDS